MVNKAAPARDLAVGPWRLPPAPLLGAALRALEKGHGRSVAKGSSAEPPCGAEDAEDADSGASEHPGAAYAEALACIEAGAPDDKHCRAATW